MYRYDEFDARFVAGRVEQFRDQIRRRLAGELSEEQFRPLRLMNGLYLQLHAYMLRVAVPYGTMNSHQLRKLAHIARRYDRGYAHFTTRQNIQFNWPRLDDVPEILDQLAGVQMHAIQTSGNCIRNVTTDQFAGAAKDEIIDPRPVAEIIRQWSSLHPEFSFLPRKFKIAITGAPNDRAAIRFHDIGLMAQTNAQGQTGWAVYLGGGMGRTPMIARAINDFIPHEDLLAYLESVLRVYNRFGRRDNKYKARIKILVHEEGLESVREQVELEFALLRGGELTLPEAELERINSYFLPPAFKPSKDKFDLVKMQADNPELVRFVKNNCHPHARDGYTSVTISLKPIGGVPGDASSEQMELVADLADKFSFGELRVSHAQNLVLPHVAISEVEEVHRELSKAGLGEANIDQITDIIACPGLDFCALANARSIPLAQDISNRFASAKRQEEIGELKIKISGCINACGHHHAGHIGILGVEKKGTELYQITLGGDASERAAIGSIVGPGLKAKEVPAAIERMVAAYLGLRQNDKESFIEVVKRVGETPFKEAVYERV